MPLRCVPARRRSPGELVAVLLAVLVTVLGPVLASTAAPAAAAGPPHVVSTDVLVVWDGTRETYAVRWHLSAPVRQVRWLVATPGEARAAAVDDGAFARFADVAAPRDRWVVTHPWLLFSDDGDRARAHLAAVRRAGPGARVAATALTGRDVPDGAGVPRDAAARKWSDDAARRGWRTLVVTVTAPVPTTVVGPVALDFAATTPVVPSSAWPRGGGGVTVLAVAPRVLAPEQPDVAVSRSSVPVLTVDNARTMPGTDPLLAGRAAPSGGWVVTSLSGRQTAAPAALLPQPGPIADWRTQVGVWWPGWASAALTVLVLAVLGVLATVVGRRRARRAAAVPRPRAALPGVVRVDLRDADDGRDPADTLTDLVVPGFDEDPADTRPDIRPVR